MARRIAVIGDMHVGATVGLHPLEWTTKEDVTYLASESQRHLLAAWEDFTGQASRCDTLLLLGDLCEGSNRKELGRGTINPDLDTQVKMATKLLRPLAEGKKVYGVTGSPYHQSLDLRLDNMVVHELEGEVWGEIGHRKIEGTDRYLFATHGGGAPYMYPGTYLNKESDAIDKGLGRGELQNPVHVWLCGHWHFMDSHYRVRSKRHLWINGCWKLWWPWKPLTKFWGDKTPTIGGLIITVENSGRIDIQDITYPVVRVADKVGVM